MTSMPTVQKSSWRQYAGVALVCIGALLLIGCYVVHIEANFELFLGLGLIVFGAALHVRALKKGEKY